MFANQKGQKLILRISEVIQDKKRIGLMGQAGYQAVSQNQSRKSMAVTGSGALGTRFNGEPS